MLGIPLPHARILPAIRESIDSTAMQETLLELAVIAFAVLETVLADAAAQSLEETALIDISVLVYRLALAIRTLALHLADIDGTVLEGHGNDLALGLAG